MFGRQTTVGPHGRAPGLDLGSGCGACERVSAFWVGMCVALLIQGAAAAPNPASLAKAAFDGAAQSRFGGDLDDLYSLSSGFARMAPEDSWAFWYGPGLGRHCRRPERKRDREHKARAGAFAALRTKRQRLRDPCGEECCASREEERRADSRTRWGGAPLLPCLLLTSSLVLKSVTSASGTASLARMEGEIHCLLPTCVRAVPSARLGAREIAVQMNVRGNQPCLLCPPLQKLLWHFSIAQ